MLSISLFSTLDYASKKQLLIRAFQQIAAENEESEAGRVLFLLQASDAYPEARLDSIYENIVNMLDVKSLHDEISMKQHIHEAHALLEEEASQESKNADNLLRAI